MLRDLIFASRVLRRRPALSLAAIVTLAAGIAVATTMFAFLDGLVWRPLPYPGVDRLVGLEEVRQILTGRPQMQVQTFHAVREHARSFTRVIAADEGEATVVIGDAASREQVTRTTADAFAALRVPPLIGRVPSPPALSGITEVAIGEALWERRFDRDSAVIGSQITIDGEPAAIVGVMPRRFEFYRSSDAWTVMDHAALRLDPTRMVYVIGQLRDGVSIEQARAEMEVLAAARASEHQGRSQWYLFYVHPSIVQRDAVPRPLANLLIGAAAAVFLVACVNTASLLLARALDRRGEIAIREALGAGRGALFRHSIAETLVLVGCGGLVGIGLTLAVNRFLWALTSTALPAWAQMRLDWRVGSVAFSAAVLAAVITALPALHTGRRFSLTQVVASSGVAAGGGSGRLPPAAGRLIIGQVAFAFLLVTAATLMYRSYRGLLDVESGLDVERVLAADVVMGNDRHDVMRRSAAYTVAAMDRLRGLPGVEAVASTGEFSTWWDELDALSADDPARDSVAAPAGGRMTPTETAWDSIYTEDGRVPRDIAMRLRLQSVSDDYFHVVGLPLRTGRLFGPADAASTPRSVIVSRTLSTRLWPDGEIVGRRIRFGSQGQWATVIGTVDDVQWTYQGWDGTGAGPELRLYFSAEQSASWKGHQLLIRTTSAPTPLIGTVRSELQQIPGTEVIASVHPLLEEYTRTANDRAWMTVILATCGLLTLVLAALGLYGVLALLVALRLREVGIRAALGAPAGSIAWWIVQHSLRFVGVGIAAGVLLSLLSHRVLRIFLFRVSVVDPVSYIGVAALFVVVAVVASLWPVARALKVDPVATLRQH